MAMTLRKVISVYLNKPGRYLFFNVSTGETAYGTTADYEAFMDGEAYHDGLGDWRCYEARSALFMKENRRLFLIKKKVEPSGGLLKSDRFNAFLRKNGLWDEWVDFYLNENCVFLADFAFENELDEPEASKEDYEAVRALMEEYDGEEFFKSFSDAIFFTVLGERSSSDFFVLGANEDTYGISLYRGSNSLEEVYSFLRNANGYGREHDLGLLTSFVGLYSQKKEKKPLPYGANPFGKDEAFTSTSIHQGKRNINYLSESMGKALKRQLRTIIDGLRYLRKQKGRPEKDEECNVLLVQTMGGFTFKKIERTAERLDSVEFFLEYELIAVDSPKYPLGKKTDTDYAFTFRYFPGGNFDYSDEDPRKGYVCFVGLMVDLKTGMLLRPIVFGMEDGQSFGKNLHREANASLKGMPVPRRIIVNDELDFHIADFLFANMYAKGADIVFKDMDLPTDGVYAELLEHARQFPLGDLPKA